MKLRLKKQKPEIFERRRASQGSDSPRVFSYYAKGNSNSNQNTGRHEQAVPAKKSRSYKRLIYLPSYVALFMILIAGIYSCWLQPNPKVVVIATEGSVFRSNQDYQTGIAVLWHRSILNQTKLTVHGATIKSDILTQYSELSDVRLELPLLGRRPTIIITPARPTLQFISSNGAFYVNDQGKVMARVAEVTQNHVTTLPMVRDETGIAAEVGKNVLPESQAKFLQKLTLQFVQEGIGVESITLPPNAANEADVRVVGQSYFIKFSTVSDPRQAVGAYQAVISKLATDHLSPTQYVDVRVDEKVFYK